MPLHDFRCEDGHITEVYVQHGVDVVQCSKCGKEAGKVFLQMPMAFVQPDICYDSPIDGRPITSMAARKEDLARSGCIPYDPEMKKDQIRRIQRNDEALERAVEETVEATIHSWPARKREKLAEELASGVDVEPVRGTL